ncbi:MAG: hypothetical protein WDN50_11535 [Bradyrhizobium sp.]
MNVGCRKTSGDQMRSHRFRRARGVTRRSHGVDFDQFLVDVEGQLLCEVRPSAIAERGVNGRSEIRAARQAIRKRDSKSLRPIAAKHPALQKPPTSVN